MCTIPVDSDLGRAVDALNAEGTSDDMILSLVRLKLSRLARAREGAERASALASITDRQWQAFRDEADRRVQGRA